MKKFLALISALLILASSLAGCADQNGLSLGNTLIFGDSYSTFKGHIPDGYPHWYPGNDVKSAGQTWWKQLISETDSKLLLNSSYSGSTVCHTGYDGNDYSEISFVARTEKLISEGYFSENSVDTVIIFGGLNDYWAGSPLGEIKYADFTEDDKYSFFPALSYMLSAIKEASPDTRIIFVVCELLGDELKSGIAEICSHYCVETVEPTGIDLTAGHPSKIGMKKIADDILAYLEGSQDN